MVLFFITLVNKEENNSLINFAFVWYVVLYFILKAEDTLAPTTLNLISMEVFFFTNISYKNVNIYI